jgi:hypothetical protein
MTRYSPAQQKEDRKGAGIVLGLGVGMGLLVALMMRRKGEGPPTPKANIHGIVTDSLTESPIPQATVMAGGTTTKSGSDGIYAINGIPVGETMVTVDHPDYEPVSETINLPEGDTVFDVALLPKAIITGVVSDIDTGEVIPGAVISLDGMTTSTGPDGSYVIYRLTPGQYLIHISHPDYHAYDNTVTLARGVNVLDIALEAQAVLSGIIRDNVTNAPVEGVKVSHGPHETISDAAGRYSLSGLSADLYVITFDHPFYETVQVEVTLNKGQNTLDVFMIPLNIVFDGRRHTPQVYSMVPETNFPADYLISVALGTLVGYASIKIGDDVYCFGGKSLVEANSRSNQAWKYNLISRAWTRLPNIPNVNWSNCPFNAIGYRNGRIWMFFSEAQYLVNAGVAVFDIASESWVVTYGPIPGIPSYPLAFPADYAYYALSGSLYRLDYATGTWSAALAPQPSTSMVGGVIDGLLYILGNNAVVSRWDEQNDVWRNMLQDFPGSVWNFTRFADETNSALYCMTAETNKKLLRYAPAAGWEYICDMYAINPSRFLIAANGEHVVTFDFSGAGEVKRPALYRLIPDGVDYLGVKMLDAGDVVDIELPSGATLYIEKDYGPWMEVTQNMSVQITETRNYRFTMESRFPHEDVRISWRHP